MASFLTDLSNGPSQWTVSGHLLLNEVREQGNALGEIHTKVFIGQNSCFHCVEMRAFDAITKVMDLGSKVNSSGKSTIDI